MKKVYVEKYNASDDSFELTEINFEPGSKVEKDDIIFSIESSKADIDIESKFSGYIYYKIKLNQSIIVGELFYVISDNKIDDFDFLFNNNIKDKTYEDVIISAKAKKIISSNNIDPLLLQKKIIKEQDVLDFIKINNKTEILSEHTLKKIGSVDLQKHLIILGAKGGAKMVIDAINSCGEYKVFGLLDDTISVGEKVFSIDVLGKFSLIDELINNGFINFVFAFGIIENRKKRFKLFTTMKKKGAKFANIVHKKAIVEDSVKMGEGNVILAGANVGSAVEMGDLNYINNSSVISHDSVIHNNVHVAPGAVLASSIELGSHSLIGMNSTLFYGIKIGENVVVNNGIVVNNDILSDTILK